MKYKDVKDMKSCIEAAGNYGTLWNILYYLKNEFGLDFNDDIQSKLDEAYDEVQREEFYSILRLFNELELHNYEYDSVWDFLDTVEFTDADFKKKSIMFIIKCILPNHEEWCDERFGN